MTEEKKEKLFILIVVLVATLLPTIAGVTLMLIFQRSVILESLYAIFGAGILIVALFRSWRRDSVNYRKDHTVVEDKETSAYKSYRNMQIALYITGAALLIMTGVIYVLGYFVFQF